MTNIEERMYGLCGNGFSRPDAIALATAEQLERIADALVKQDAGQGRSISEMTLDIQIDNYSALKDVAKGMDIEKAILKNMKVT